jgi:hypothetical protein
MIFVCCDIHKKHVKKIAEDKQADTKNQSEGAESHNCNETLSVPFHTESQNTEENNHGIGKDSP